MNKFNFFMGMFIAYSSIVGLALVILLGPTATLSPTESGLIMLGMMGGMGLGTTMMCDA